MASLPGFNDATVTNEHENCNLEKIHDLFLFASWIYQSI